jgi:GH25 family lysozyme M1 (1,4-beta-N-acetylmuramidase)
MEDYRMARSMIRYRWISVAAAVALLVAGSATAAGAATPGTASEGSGWAHADASGARAATAPAGYPVRGIDVSNYQGSINWPSIAAAGVTFAYAKATEGLSYVDSTFAANDSGAKANSVDVGAYHFGRPDLGSAAAQADHFLANARFTHDGRTLPPMLDIETGSSVGLSNCYGLSTSAMVNWISGFVIEVRAKTGSPTMIYTAAGFWNPCTGSSSAFGADYLFVANWSSSPTPLPGGWSTWTFWQYADSGSLPGDQDVFNGTVAQLAQLAGGHGADSFGFFDPGNGSVHLRNELNGGSSEFSWVTGLPAGSGVVPLVGDWDGDGVDSFGYFDPGNGSVHLRNELNGGSSEFSWVTGLPAGSGVVPLVGDWNGDGVDSFGYFDPANGSVHLRNELNGGSSEYSWVTGLPANSGVIPLTGDWDGR